MLGTLKESQIKGIKTASTKTRRIYPQKFTSIGINLDFDLKILNKRKYFQRIDWPPEPRDHELCLIKGKSKVKHTFILDEIFIKTGQEIKAKLLFDVIIL